MAMKALSRRLTVDDKGQMTVEFMVILPVALIIALIAVNALTFFSECAAFDRVARNAVRVYATSPTYGENAAQIRAKIESTVDAAMREDNETVQVSAEGRKLGLTEYTATLEYSPTLFGLGLRDSILGVALPHLTHSTSLTVSTYKPGVFF